MVNLAPENLVANKGFSSSKTNPFATPPTNPAQSKPLAQLAREQSSGSLPLAGAAPSANPFAMSSASMASSGFGANPFSASGNSAFGGAGNPFAGNAFPTIPAANPNANAFSSSYNGSFGGPAAGGNPFGGSQPAAIANPFDKLSAGGVQNTEAKQSFAFPQNTQQPRNNNSFF